MKEIGIYNYEVFILVMLPRSAIVVKLLTQSLFTDRKTDHRSGNDSLPYCYWFTKVSFGKCLILYLICSGNECYLITITICGFFLRLQSNTENNNSGF